MKFRLGQVVRHKVSKQKGVIIKFTKRNGLYHAIISYGEDYSAIKKRWFFRNDYLDCYLQEIEEDKDVTDIWD